MALTIIAIVLLLAVVTMFALDRSWNNVTLDKRNDLVFENKNKKYGAFFIRKSYNKTVLTALGITVAIVAVGVGTNFILGLKDSFVEEKQVTMDEVKLVEPPPVKEEVLPPPPPPPPPPPTIKQIQFTEPEVTEEEVKEIPPQQEEIKGKIGDENVEGEEDVLAPIDAGQGVGGEDNEVYAFAQEQPSFPGGNDALYKFLGNNIKYPPMEEEMEITGTVVIGFTVDKNGEITDIVPIKEVKGGPNLTKEAIRVIKTMPKWSPGKNNGKPVKVNFKVPVRFSLKN